MKNFPSLYFYKHLLSIRILLSTSTSTVSKLYKITTGNVGSSFPIDSFLASNFFHNSKFSGTFSTRIVLHLSILVIRE